MSTSSEQSGNRNRQSQKPAMYDHMGASGAAARFGLYSDHAPPKVGYSGSPERLDEEDDDDPVTVGEGRPSKSAGAHVDEFDTLVIDSDDMECRPSYGSNASRTKELEALMARSEDIVRRMTRDTSGGRQSSSEEEENEDEDESDTAELYEDREHVSNVFPAMSSTHSRSCVQGRVNFEDDGDNDNYSQSKYVYLHKMPREGTPCINWPQQDLRRVCGHRKIKNMSRSKDMTRMAEMLGRLDAALKRSGPYFEDCRKMGDDTSSTARSTTKTGVISSGSCTTFITRHIPDEVKAQYIAWTVAGGVLHSRSQQPFGGQSFDADEIRTPIEADEKEKPRSIHTRDQGGGRMFASPRDGS